MEPDDIIIECTGFVFNVSEYEGKFIGQFEDQAEAELAIREWMDYYHYWPAIWFVSDHGNVSPYMLDDEK